MSENKREHEISAPNRHSHTDGNPSGLFEKLPGKSTNRQYFPAVFNYLNDWRWSPCLPHPNRILALLVPQAVKRGLAPRPYGFAT